jgi:hypothetical protein
MMSRTALSLPIGVARSLNVGQPALAMVRPEHVRFSTARTPTIEGVIERSTFLGTHIRHDVVTSNDGKAMRRRICKGLPRARKDAESRMCEGLRPAVARLDLSSESSSHRCTPGSDPPLTVSSADFS